MSDDIREQLKQLFELIVIVQADIKEINQRLDNIEGHHSTLIATSEEIRKILKVE